VNLPQIEEGLVSWIQEASQARRLSMMAVRDGMRDLGVEVHPKTVETWFRGTSMPGYVNLVALARLFHELPPPLAEVCPPDIAPVAEAEGHLLDIADSDPAPQARPNPRHRS
jgi:hypothetical protein